MSDTIQLYCGGEGIWHLPNEILVIIINKLASDKDNDNLALAALASCRLASHLLYSVATPLMFSSIQLIGSLTPTPWVKHKDKVVAFMKRATKLKQILTTSEIAASVHTLTLRCQKANLQDWKNGSIISAIIRCLPHIRTFILECGGAMLNFAAIVGKFKSAIESLCRSPNLTTLHFGGIINFPTTIITGTGACPNLQCLRLSCVLFQRFDHTNLIDETSSLQPYKLDTLQIDEYSLNSLGSRHSDLYRGGSPFAKRFSQIRNLRLQNLFFNDIILKRGWDIMFLAAQSLKTLDLSWHDEFSLLYIGLSEELGFVPFDLGRFPALRHLKIQMRIPPTNNVTLLFFLSRLLSISSSTSGIETLEITITWVGVESGCEKNLCSPDGGLSMLDKVLSSEKFVSLQRVVFELRLKMREGDGDPFYRNRTNLELERSLTPYANTLFPKLAFRELTSAQRTPELLHVEINVF